MRMSVKTLPEKQREREDRFLQKSGRSSCPSRFVRTRGQFLRENLPVVGVLEFLEQKNRSASDVENKNTSGTIPVLFVAETICFEISGNAVVSRSAVFNDRFRKC